MHTFQNETILGAYLDCKESMYIEFKEFCLKEYIHNYLSTKQIKNMVHHGKLPKNFDYLVINNLERYIDIYLSKYASSFHNSKTKESSPMNFIIGVNDDSEITGIPFSGCIDALCDHLKQYMNQHIDFYMKDKCCLQFDITTKECEIDPAYLDDSFLAQQIEHHNRIMNHYHICNRKYTKKRKHWFNTIMRYKGKLQNAVCDPLFIEEFSEYLKSIHKYEAFKQHLHTNYTYDPDQVKYFKDDPEHFMYWVIQYKDMKANEWMAKKPIPPSLQKLPNIEFCASTQLSMLRYRLIHGNQKLKYFTICITISKNNHCSKKLYFKDHRHHLWRTMCRMIDNNEPHSFDI
jgi:hypothetical protein